ncbi:MAG: OmpA/MotB domain protein [Segetibacter sp.]|nr:OmpA/MotB domain protein [Segetibacter sp.]
MSFCLIHFNHLYGQNGGGNKCNLKELPSIKFRSNNANLIAVERVKIDAVADSLKANPFCSIVVTAHPPASKAGQFLCSKRMDAITKYFVDKKGISQDRITINCEFGGGDPNTVDLTSN